MYSSSLVRLGGAHHTMTMQEPLSSNHRANNLMRGVHNTVSLRSVTQKSKGDDEMEGDEEADDNAMEIDEYDVDEMETTGTPSVSKKNKSKKNSSVKVGVKLNEYELWVQKRFLTTSEVYCWGLFPPG